MNKIALSILMVLSGCSIVGPTYDTNEYAAFASIAYIAEISQPQCENNATFDQTAQAVFSTSKYAEVFTRHQKYNDGMHSIAELIVKHTQELVTASRTDKMTVQYCKFKLESIQRMAEEAMSATISKRRQP